MLHHIPIIHHGKRQQPRTFTAIPPDVPRGVVRVRDAEQNWRIMYRIDVDAVLVLDVYAKKTRKIPDEVLTRCQQRLKHYDAVVRSSKGKP